jgi:hypothetical protein
MKIDFNTLKKSVYIDYFRKNPIGSPGTAARVLNNQVK